MTLRLPRRSAVLGALLLFAVTGCSSGRVAHRADGRTAAV